jgi:hypothetical protein
LKAIASAMSQLQTVQQALQGITYPQIASLTINLRDLSEEQIGAMLGALPTGYRKRGKES